MYYGLLTESVLVPFLFYIRDTISGEHAFKAVGYSSSLFSDGNPTEKNYYPHQGLCACVFGDNQINWKRHEGEISPDEVKEYFEERTGREYTVIRMEGVQAENAIADESNNKLPFEKLLKLL